MIGKKWWLCESYINILSFNGGGYTVTVNVLTSSSLSQSLLMNVAVRLYSLAFMSLDSVYVKFTWLLDTLAQINLPLESLTVLPLILKTILPVFTVVSVFIVAVSVIVSPALVVMSSVVIVGSVVVIVISFCRRSSFQGHLNLSIRLVWLCLLLPSFLVLHSLLLWRYRLLLLRRLLCHWCFLVFFRLL